MLHKINDQKEMIFSSKTQPINYILNSKTTYDNGESSNENNGKRKTDLKIKQ